MAEAACEEILAGYFPNIDDEYSSYIKGVVSSYDDDIETADDLFEVIGSMLEELDSEMSSDTIRQICTLLHDARINGPDHHKNSNHKMKVLDSPLQICHRDEERDDDCSSALLKAIRPNNTKANNAKIEKLDAKRKDKLEKRALADAKPKVIEQVVAAPSASQQVNRKDTRLEASGQNKSYDIRIENFDVSYGELTLIRSADLVMTYGRRYGLVGRNGIGKTTLLRALANRSLQIPSHISVLHVEQEVVGDDTMALESVLECDVRRHALLQEEKAINTALQNNTGTGDTLASSRLSEIYAELQSIEADKAPARAAVILSGLGFNPEKQRRPTREFSGGWRMRLALARALFSRPDLLLLDEPTNMLDMKAVIWLETYLQTWPSSILVVSHDREFLNTVATDILHLHSQIIDAYRGDYENFVKTRSERLKNQQREYDAQLEYRQHIQVFIDRFRYNANRASQVQSKLKILEKLPELVPVQKESEVIFRFPEVEKLSSPILQLDEVFFYYMKDTPIFDNVCISANMESRICIVGENGAGKTTLLKILLGDLNPVRGIRHAHRNLRIGYFSQHHVDQLDMNVCSVEVLAAKFPGKPSEYYRGQLGQFGVSGDLATRPVVSLSGGQKSRVAFALLSMMNPNFFILDEPTNHLDMETIEALGKALHKFQGGVVLVSHDERLIRLVCNEMWICGDYKVRQLDGGIDEYKRLVQQEMAAAGMS